MPDIFTTEKRSAVMSLIRGSGNKDVVRMWECVLAQKHWPKIARRLVRALATRHK